MKKSGIVFFVIIGVVLLAGLLRVANNGSKKPTKESSNVGITSSLPSKNNDSKKPYSSASSASSQKSIEKVDIVYSNAYAYIDALDKEALMGCYVFENTGNVPVRITDLSVDLISEDGKILKVKENINCYPHVIAPGENAYAVEDLINWLDQDVTVGSVSKAVVHFYCKAEEKEAIPAVITQAGLGESLGGPALIGAIKNKSAEMLDYICISAPVFSSDGNLQTVITGVVEKLGPNEEKGFDIRALNYDPAINYSNAYIGDVSIFPIW